MNNIVRVGRAIFAVLGGGATVGASSTIYATPFGTNATEANAQIPCVTPATFGNLFIQTSSAQPAGGSLVITLRRNGAATPITVTIAASAAAGVYSDALHTQACAAGDLWDIQCTNNAASTSAAIASLQIQYS